MSSANNIKANPASAFAHSLPGLVVLSTLYAIYGLFLTIVRVCLFGSKRFFKQSDRSLPPHKAQDTIHGHHDNLKLKSSAITLHYVSRGVPSQPLMLFLHGFPECWFAWRHQMKYFSKHYRVVAIDLRGFGLSSKPQFVSDYKIETLAGDTADVIEQLGYESCVLVGHDCGGFVAWMTAMLYPHLVESLVIMNCPHPNAFRYDISFNGLEKIWFWYFAQTPFIPEMYFLQDDLAVVKKNYHQRPSGLVNKVLISEEDIEVFKHSLAQRGTVRSAINFYRAFLRYQKEYSNANISAPVLLLWGLQDRLYGEDLADASAKYCSNIQVKKIPNCSHWINQDIPDIVNQHIELFLKERPGAITTYLHDF